MDTQLLLIRHGQSTSNADPKLAVGQDINAPLSSLGSFQARLLAARLTSEYLLVPKEGTPVDQRALLFSSDQVRARETAEWIVERTGLSLIERQLLREMEQPGFHDIPEEKMDTVQLLSQGADYHVPDGETLRDVACRMETWYSWALDYSRRQEIPIIIAVSHGLAIRALLWRILNFDTLFFRRIKLGNTSITKLVWEDKRGWVLHTINDTAHLRVLNQEADARETGRPVHA